MIDIAYDRKERIYKWTEPESGEVLTAPSGAPSKAALFQTAVAMTNPELWEAAARWIGEEPYLERAIWKGVELVVNDGVELFDLNGRLLALVQSSDEYGRYGVSNIDGYVVCECPHYQDGGAAIDRLGQKTCKHIAAYRLAQTQESRF